MDVGPSGPTPKLKTSKKEKEGKGKKFSLNEIQEACRAEIEAKERKRSAVIRHLPESCLEAVHSVSTDINSVKTLLNLLDIDAVPTNCFRMGVRRRGPRPLKVIFARSEDLNTLLAKKKQVSKIQKFKGIWIDPSRTKEERAELAKKRQNTRKSNSKGNVHTRQAPIQTYHNTGVNLNSNSGGGAPMGSDPNIGVPSRVPLQSGPPFVQNAIRMGGNPQPLYQIQNMNPVKWWNGGPSYAQCLQGPPSYQVRQDHDIARQSGYVAQQQQPVQQTQIPGYSQHPPQGIFNYCQGNGYPEGIV